MPKVSIIVPVYNTEKYIGDCIQSILQQSLKDVELILVNDCSTDHSIEILKQLNLFTEKQN
nr:glycosyltransferase [Streptococcus suis]